MKNAGEVSKNCVFRPVEKSPAQTSYRGKFVHPPQSSASTTVRWSRNTRCRLNSGGSRNWRCSWHQHLCGIGICRWHPRHLVLAVRWLIDACTNLCRYSGIKRGSSWKRSSDWHAISYSYNSRPRFQLTARRAGLSAIAELLVKISQLQITTKSMVANFWQTLSNRSPYRLHIFLPRDATLTRYMLQ